MMNTNKIESVNTELREQISKYTNRLNELSVYNKDELIEKGQLLSNLQIVEASLLETLSTLKTSITEQKQVLEKYMRDAEENFSAVRKTIYNTTVVAKPEATYVSKVTKVLPPKSLKPFTNTSNNNNGWIEVGKKKFTPKLVRREVAPDLFIQAVTVTTTDDAQNNAGWWCWCPHEHRFCISINGKVYSGNTTLVRQMTDQPVKFFEHRRCDKVDNWKDSDYYVPMEKNSSSRDIRQFTNKMKFVPASRSPERFEAYCYRIGSRDTLKDDVLSLKPEDYRLFSDLTCNFLLCLTTASMEMDRRDNADRY
jgi:hypothetical protein